MKKLLLAAVGLLALGMGAPASAADLAARPYAPVVAIYNWSGFYIGINGGGGSAQKCWDFLADSERDRPGPEGCHDATGGTIGGQIGYRWQSANWVFGVEGQGNWADFTGSNVSFLFAPDFNRSKIDSFGLITGQVGYAWNNVLFYVKGGVAATGDTYEAFSGRTGALLASANETRWGGTVGVGLEYGFAPNWSVGAEYDHLFMGSRDVTLTAPSFFQIEHIQQDVDIGLVRLNYRFNGFGGFGAPFAARY
jgi:outer membrane immunogenic protein